MNIRILESAIEDLKEGVAFYDQHQKGVGEYFKESIFSDIESLKLFPGAHPLHFEEYHRLLSKRFPFAIYYKVEKENINIYAILDCRRNPAWIRKQFEE